MLSARSYAVTMLAGTTLALTAGSALGAASKYGRAPGLDNPVLQAGDHAAYSAGRVVVKFRAALPAQGAAKSSGTPAIDAILHQHAVVAIDPVSKQTPRPSKPGLVDLGRVYEVRYADGADALDVAREFAAHPEVEYAEPLFVYGLDLVPNDPNYAVSQAQYMAKMNFPNGWGVTTGGTGNVVVAICDGGTDWDHADLHANVWTNPGEIAANGIDDDHNGFVDDVHGWNFANGTNDPTGLPATPSSANHGTHVAGIACAATNNVVGVAGASYNAKFMPICTSSPTTDLAIAFGYDGIIYAADNHADVVNCSWGGAGSPSAFEQDVITYAYQHGTAVVCAAGNTSTEVLHLPSGYDHVLAVCNVQNNDVRNSSSTYGIWVDVAALGTNILSTFNSPANGYGVLTGTSMASPQAAGLCALVKTRFPGYSPEQVMQRVRVTADNIDALNAVAVRGKLGYGRINAARALTKATPAISVVGKSFTTSDGDAIIEPGETVTLNLQVTNWLAACSNVNFKLRDNSVNITEVDSSVAVAGIDSMQTATLAPLTFTVSPSSPIQHTVLFTVAISAGAPAYSDVSRFELTVLPVFATHDANHVDCSVTSVGKLGYALAAGGTGKDGIGFSYKGSASYLFEGGLMIGNSPAAISNACRVGGTAQDDDFLTLPNGVPMVTEPAPPYAEVGFASFNDAISDVPLGLTIQQMSIESTAPANQDFLVLRYKIRNDSGTPLNGLYAGWYCDWDIDSGSSGSNKTGYDAAHGMMYAFDTSANGPKDYVGIMTLSALGTTAARGIWNDPIQASDWGVYDGYTDAEKFQTIATAGQSHVVIGPGDISVGLGTGPLNLAPGASAIVAFAFLGGTSLADLQTHAGAAQVMYNGMPTDTGPGDDPVAAAPKLVRLAQNAPNPFNPTTAIAFDLPRSAAIDLKIYAVDGHLVRTLLHETRAVGAHRTTWDGRDDAGHLQPSGTYFYRFAVEGAGSIVRKMQLLK